MAYLSGLSSLGKKPSPGLAAITGFGQGVLKGIETTEQIKAQRIRSAVLQQEMALRQRALQHGLDKEQQVQDWSRSLGEYQAWRAGTEDEIEQQGPPAPEQNVDPGFVGPQPQAAGKLGRSPNFPAIDQKLMDLARTIPDARTRDAFLETVAQEEKTRAAMKSRDSLLQEIKNRRLQKGYRSTTIDGAEDVAGEEMAMSFEEQLSQLDPTTDPDGVAAVADKIREDDRNFRIDAARNNVQIGKRMKTEADLDMQIQARESVPGYDSSEARTLQALWKQHLITDAQLGQMLPDALNGTLALKAQVQQLQKQNAEMQLERAKLQMESERLSMPTQEDRAIERGGKIQDMFRTKAETERIKADTARMRGQGVGSDKRDIGPRDRVQFISDYIKDGQKANSEAVMPEDRKSIVQLRKEAIQAWDAIVSGQEPEGESLRPVYDEIKTKARAEGWDRDEIIKALKAAGIDPNAPPP